MIFTPQNLIQEIKKIGAWSAYGLATEALQYYFPEEYNEDGDCIEGAKKECELLYKLDCNSWQDVIIKYQNEIRYKCKEFNQIAVNEH